MARSCRLCRSSLQPSFCSQVEEEAQEARVQRLLEWRRAGDAWAYRLDNCDVGKLLHFIAMIATRLVAPPPLPFPFSLPRADDALSRSTECPDLLILGLEHYAYDSAIEVSALGVWWECFDALAKAIQHSAAADVQGLGRADLLRRVKGGLGTSIIHSGRALGLQNELLAIGPAPALPAPSSPVQVTPQLGLGSGYTNPNQSTPPPAPRALRPSLVSPQRRTVAAVSDYTPSESMPNGISVSMRGTHSAPV